MEEYVWVVQDSQLIMIQSQMAIYDPDTQEVIPKGTASMVNCIKSAVSSLYSERGDCPTLPTNAKIKQFICFI